MRLVFAIYTIERDFVSSSIHIPLTCSMGAEVSGSVMVWEGDNINIPFPSALFFRFLARGGPDVEHLF